MDRCMRHVGRMSHGIEHALGGVAVLEQEAGRRVVGEYAGDDPAIGLEPERAHQEAAEQYGGGDDRKRDAEREPVGAPDLRAQHDAGGPRRADCGSVGVH
jgi:hypothetical protein